MPHSHLEDVCKTMIVSWQFFLKGFGLSKEELEIEFLKHSGLTKIRFSPKAVSLIKESFDELCCCCKLKIEFADDIITVHAENFAMASAEIQYLIGGIATAKRNKKNK